MKLKTMAYNECLPSWSLLVNAYSFLFDGVNDPTIGSHPIALCLLWRRLEWTKELERRVFLFYHYIPLLTFSLFPFSPNFYYLDSMLVLVIDFVRQSNQF